MKRLLLAAQLSASSLATPVAAQPAFDVTAALAGQALFGCEGVRLFDGVVVDAAGNSTGTSKGSLGHVVSGRDVVAEGRVAIRGDAVAGIAGEVRTSPGTTIAGSTGRARFMPNCRPVDLAPHVRLLSSRGNPPIPVSAAGRAVLKGPAGTDFVLESFDHVTLATGTYVFTSIRIADRSSVALAGPVRILCTGPVEIRGSSHLNASGGPFLLRLFSTGPGVLVEGLSSLGGILYAPDADVELRLESRALGGVFGRTVTLRDSSTFTRILDETPPVLSILSPADREVVPGLTGVHVRGVAGDPETAVTLTVNGKDVALAPAGEFEADVDLPPSLEVVADAANAASLTTSRRVAVCVPPPQIQLLSPADGAYLGGRHVVVRGLSGTATEVTVNGVAAKVTGGEFLLDGYDFPGDGLQTLVVVGSNACNSARLAVAVLVDSSPPSATIDSPADGTVFASSPITVAGSFRSLRVQGVTVNGVAAAVTGDRFVATGVPIPPGSSSLVAVVTDALGRTGRSAPVNVRFEAQALAVFIAVPLPGTFFRSASVDVRGNVSGGTPVSVTVNGVAAALSGRDFTALGVPLVEGENRLVAEATDDLTRRARSPEVLVIRDTTPPVVAIDAASVPAFTQGTAVSVSGTVQDPYLDFVMVNGVRATVSGTQFFVGSVPVEDGPNALRAHAVDRAGNATDSNAVTVIRKTQPPVIRITSPLSRAMIASLPITVTGTVSDPYLAGVTVMEKAATVTGGTFEAAGVTLPEGDGTVTARATDLAGLSATSTVPVSVDTKDPVVTLDPLPAVVGTRTITVTGTVDEPHLSTVTVAGVSATVAGRSFTAEGVTLAEGPNRLTAVATDTFGHRGESSAASVELDTSTPVLTLDVPALAAGACLPAGVPVTLGGLSQTRSGAPASVRVSVADSSGGLRAYTATPGADGKWNVPDVSVGGVDGTFLISLVGTGAAGHAARLSRSFRVKASSPSLQILLDGGTFPGSAAGAPPAGGTPALIGRSVVPRVLVSDGPAAAPPAAALTLDGSPFTEGSTISSEGTHLLVARAVDCAGHEGLAYARFTLDLSPPRLVSTTPGDGAVSGVAVPSFSGTADRALAAALVNGFPAQVSGTSFTLTPFPWREGANAVTIELTSLAGNRATYTRSFTARTLALRLEILESGLPLVSGTRFFRAVVPVLRPSDPAATVAATLNGAPFASGTSVDATGDYTLSATATDALSRTVSTAASFHIDRTSGPRVDITSPAEGAIVTGPTIPVSGTISASVVRVAVNGRSAALAGTVFTLADLAVPSGEIFEITAVAEDGAGRSASVTRQVFVRGPGPRIVVTEPVDGTMTNRTKIDVAGAVIGGPSATADGSVSVAGSRVALDASGAFRARDVAVADGPNTYTVTAVDSGGRTGSTTVRVTGKTTPPSIRISANGQPLADGAAFPGPVTIRVEALDPVAAPPVPDVRLNGQPQAATSSAVDIPVSASGGYSLAATARDAAGNETRATRSFTISGGGCALSDFDPADGASVSDSRVTFRGRSGDAASVVVRVSDGSSGFTAYAARLADETFAVGDLPLPVVGTNRLAVDCTSRSGAAASASLTLVRLAGSGPVVRITTPPAGVKTGLTSITVSGTVSDSAARVTVNGVLAAVSPATGGGSFTLAGVTLAEGPNVLTARAVDAASRTGEERVVVYRDTAAPQVQITSPQNGSHLGPAGGGSSFVEVTGLVDLTTEPNLASVVVTSPAGSVTATVDLQTGAFRALAVPLQPGPASASQTITATATDTLGHVGTSTTAVTFDPAGPALVLSAPADLARYTEASGPSFRVSGEAWAADGAQISVNGGGLDPSTLAWDAAGSDGRRHTAFLADVTLPTSDGGLAVVVRVEDPAGNYATARRLLFKESAAPAVVEMQPPDGTAQAEPDEIPLVLFSKSVLPSSLAAADGLTLTRLATGEKVAATTTIAGSAVALVPGASLLRAERYRFRAGAQVIDLAGHPLAAAKESLFTVAASPTAAPVLDTLPAVVCASQLAVTGKTAAFATVRVRLGSLAFTGGADSAGKFTVTVPLPGSGYYNLRVAALDRDGTAASPEATALVRVDCSAPTVSGAAFDRTTGRVTISFSEAMNGATLTVGGSGASIRLSDAADGARTAQAAALSLSSDGIVATLDLGSAADAWWRTRSVRFEVRAPAADANGNALGAAFETVFFLSGGADPSGGFLAGEAYDDATGRPLAGADARLYSSSAVLPLSAAPASVGTPVASATTDGRGRFSLVGSVSAGRYALVLTRAGYTRAVRRFPLEPSTGLVPFDARLTPLSAVAGALNVASGGTFTEPSGSGLTLDVSANALPGTSFDVRITPLSGQALPELLPLGWSPLAAAEVRLESAGVPLPEAPATLFVANTVRLTLPLPAETPPAATLFAVGYDAASGLWLTLPVPERSTSTSGAPLARVTLTGPGTVAVVLPDDAPSAPSPLPSAPETPLPGVSLPSPIPALSATIALDPPVVAPSGRATARVLAKSADGTSSWPSGLAVQAWLDEKLVLSGGGELYEAPFSADLVLYRAPLSSAERGSAAASAAGTMTFRVSPSPKAAEVLLETGFENIRLYPFPEQLERGGVLGPAGGSIVSSDGIELELPEGALVDRIVTGARFLTAGELSSLPVPAGYTLVAAIRLDLSGRTLNRPGTIRILTPSGLVADPADDPRLVLTRLVESPSDGRGAFSRLVARVSRTASVGGNPSKLVAAPEGSFSTLPLAGLVTEGVHLFLRASSPIGFVTGFVKGPSGLGVEGSRVTAAGLGTADLSLPGGRYAVVSPAGAVSLTALHPQTNESGTARIASLAKGDVATLDIVLTPVPPTIRSLQPASGATDQPVGSIVAIAFSTALDPTSVTATTLTVELASPDGTGTGLLFNGSLSLSPDRTTIVFAPTRPLPPGRTIRATFRNGVRGADRTMYAGTLPVAWSFTTSKQFVAGGAIHPERIKLVLPAGGVAEVVGADGALPTVPSGTPPWSVWFDVDGAPACPTVVTTSANGAGGFTATAGCPPTAPVTISSAVYIHVIDSTGGPAATWKLGPFVTADGRGFVAPPGETTVITTPDGIEVMSPAAAFDMPTLVTVTKLDPSTLGVPVQPGMEIGAYVGVEFDGTANETIRLKIPTTTTAAVGSLAFAGTPVDLPWGRRLQMLDVGRIVAGPSGQKLISNYEEDQPADPPAEAISGGRTALGVTSLQGLKRCRFTDKKTGDVFYGICPLLRTILAEFTARGTGVFISGASAQLAAITGQAQIFELGKQFEVLYNVYADTFIYLPVPQDWNGHYILPVVVGAPLRIVIRDRAAGWVRAQQDFAAVTGGAGSLIRVPEFSPRTSKPPSILESAPFGFSRFHAPLSDGGLSCLALRLEVQGCSTGLGAALLRSGGGSFLLAEGGQVELFNVDAGRRSGAATVDRFGLFPDLTVPAQASDELMAVLTPGDLDPGTLSEFSFSFDQALIAITDLPAAAKLFDCGPREDAACANAPVPVESIQSAAGDLLSVVPAGTLPYGHRFRLELNPAVIQVRGVAGPIAYPAWAPASFVFATRKAANGPIGSLPNSSDPVLSLGDTDSARDLLKFGNLLMVASAAARILAIDVSDPARPTRFAILNNSDRDVRSLATDGHNRLFYNFVGAATWGLGAIRIEDVRRASPSACAPSLPAWAAGMSCFDRVLGGVRTALAPGFAPDLTGSEFLSLVGSLPTGTPTSLQILVEDSTEDDEELKDFYDAHVRAGGFDELVPDADGFYTFSVKLDTTGHRAQRGQTCPDERPWDRFQRVTIDDVTTAQSWSFDVENPWPDSGGNGTLIADGIRARRGDRLRVRYNLRALGYLAVLGSGISVVDLNRFYRTPLAPGVGTGGQNNLAECGRRLGKLEGQDITFPGCSTADGRPVTTPQNGIALTSDLVVLPAPGASSTVAGGAAGGIGIFSALRGFGAVQSGSPDESPGQLEIGDIECLRGVGIVTLRSVALADGVDYQYEHNHIDLLTGAVIHERADPFKREGRTLVFFSLGDAGILVTDVTDGLMDPIGLLQRAGHSIYRLQTDVKGGRLFAGGTADGLPVIDVWNLAAVNEAPQQFGSDPRFLLSVVAPWDTNHIALDEAGTGLLFTWGQGAPGRQGGLAIPIENPKFVFPGVFLEGENGIVSGAPKPVVRVADRLYPLGVPTRIDPKDEVDPAKRNESQQKATAAFKVRLALPGGLGIPENDLDEITAKVQTLRTLPESRLLAQENLGRAVAVPGGSAWPSRDVFVRLKRVGKAAKTDGPLDTGENGRFATVYNLYESKEVVLLIADPRARKEYRSGAAGTPSSDISSERLQCRRCDRPAYLGVFADSDIKELLAGGPYVRAFLAVDPDSPAATRDKTRKVLDFFGDPAIRENYGTPIGTAPVAAWADSVPSAVQVSQAEPAQNAAAFSPGEAGVNVSMVSGDLVLRAADHTVAGRGLAFLFDRTYRSGMAGYGPLGAAGWSANLFAHLRVLPPIEELGFPGEIEYYDGSGNVFRFYPPQNGACPLDTDLDKAASYCAPKGLYVRLIQLEAGKGWRLFDRQHGMISFDASGRLVDNSDRFRQGEDDPEKQGNTLRFGYDGFGFLVHVGDDLGRPYRFTYKDDPVADGNEYGLLARMTDFHGREVSYQYDPAHERLLTGVTFPGVTNPFYPGFGVPTPQVTYWYSDPGLSPNAPLHEKFGKLRLRDFTLPGGSKPRADFAFETASGRVSEVRFPTDGPSSVVWRIGSYQGAADQAATGATVTAPWGHEAVYSFERGRISTKSEMLPYVVEDDTEVVKPVETKYFYTADGRASAISWADGSQTIYCYADSGCPETGPADRLSLPNILAVSRARGTAPKGPARHDDIVKVTVGYDSDGQVANATDPLGRPVVKAVPSAGGTSVSGYPGEKVGGTSTFDERGRLKSFTGDPAGKPINVSLTYDDVKGSPNYGRLVHMRRGIVGESYLYDSVGNLRTKTTTYGVTSTMDHDEWDREIQTIEGTVQPDPDHPGVPPPYPPVAGAVTQRAYDAAGHILRERRNQDPLGLVETRYVYNHREQLVDVFQTHLAAETPDGSVLPAPVRIAHNDYDPVSGLIVSSVSAEGTVTHYGYDSAGRLATTQTGLVPAQVQNPQSTGGVRRQAYDLMGRVALETDGDKGIWRGRYDAWGRLYQERLPTLAFVEREHDASGNVLGETVFDVPTGPGLTPARLSERTMKVNAFGSPTEIRELLKPGAGAEPDVIRLTKRTYDGNGRLVLEESGPEAGPLRREVRIEYEAGTGRLARRTDGMGNEAEFVYDQASPWPGKVLQHETVPGSGSLIDTDWVETKRDALGRTTEQKTRSGSLTLFTYDQAGNLLTHSRAGAVTRATYDGRGNVLRFDRPGARGSTFYGYDRDGRQLARLSTASLASPNLTSFEYDKPTGRLLKVTHADKKTSESYTYNPDDTLDVWTTRSQVAVKHVYDDANRLLARVPSAAPGAVNLSVVLDSSDSYAYDVASRLTSARRLTLGTGSAVAPSSVTYEDYDTGGRPGREIVGEGPARRDPLVRTYDVFDRSVGMSLPAGVGRSTSGSFLGYGHTYDDLDRTTGLCGDPVIVAQVACGGYQGSIGARFAWGGAARLYGVTTRGPLKTAHRYGFIRGPGEQPASVPVTGNDFRLGTLTIGSTQQDPIAVATSPLDTKWGGLGFGYRVEDGVKLGRKVADPSPSGVGGNPKRLSLLSNEGWSWKTDLGLRLQEARPGLGRLDDTLPSKWAFDSFGYRYGFGDEIQLISRETTAENVVFDPDVEGRIAARDGSLFRYDPEGRREEDDRFTYKWSWRGELVSVTVKPSWPGGAENPYAGQQIRYDYDAVGRLLSRTHLGVLPAGGTDDARRPFIEKRRYLWDGSTLLSESAHAEDRPDGSEGPLRWRKSYVPGASGLDDAVEVRVEIYDGSGASVLTEKLYSYLRDEQGTVTGIVEERAGADPARPPVLVRYLYDPYGQAHAELGEELYRATYDKLTINVTTPGGSRATQSVGAGAVPGALRLLFSEPVDLATLTGIVVERRLTDGSWGALTAADLAIGRDPETSEGLVLLPLSGWERTVSYRIRLTSALLATDGRGLPGTMTLQLYVPPTGDLYYDVPFPILYDSFRAAGNDLNGAFPGGASALFQGLWTDPVTGIAFARARWYDARNAAFLQEDPAQDLDSPSLYAFVGLRPNEATDPLGLFGNSKGDEDQVADHVEGLGVEHDKARNVGHFVSNLGGSVAKVILAVGTIGLATGICGPPCGYAVGAYFVTTMALSGRKAYEARREEGQTETQAVFGAAADVSGATDLYAGATNKDLITQQDLGLTDYERAGRAGSGLGNLIGFVAAPKAFRMGARFVGKIRAKGVEVAAELRSRFQEAADSTGKWPSIVPEGGWESPRSVEWRVGRHGEMPTPRPEGFESHHGVNSAWMEENVPGYKAADAPAVLMRNNPFHNATRGVFNRFRVELARRQGVSPRNLDWSKVPPGSAWRLAEEQFDAAKVPGAARVEYWKQFNKYMELLKDER